MGVTCLSPTCVAPSSSVDRTFNVTYCSNLRNDRQTMDYRLDSQRVTVFAAEGTTANFPTRMADGQMDGERFRRILSAASGFGL